MTNFWSQGNLLVKTKLTFSTGAGAMQSSLETHILFPNVQITLSLNDFTGHQL
jgi:hypothetical protein